PTTSWRPSSASPSRSRSACSSASRAIRSLPRISPLPCSWAASAPCRTPTIPPPRPAWREGAAVKAIVCREIAEDIGTLRLEGTERPPPGPGQARVRSRAAAVNFPDILTVQGKYQHKPPLPFIPGSEAAGDVVAVGEGVANVKAGDRVICGGLGGYAEEMQ